MIFISTFLEAIKQTNKKGHSFIFCLVPSTLDDFTHLLLTEKNLLITIMPHTLTGCDVKLAGGRTIYLVAVAYLYEWDQLGPLVFCVRETHCLRNRLDLSVFKTCAASQNCFVFLARNEMVSHCFQKIRTLKKSTIKYRINTEKWKPFWNTGFT